MKPIATLWLAGLLPLAAQSDFPGNPLVGPKKYTTRKVGGEVDPGAKVEEPAKEGTTVRYVSHIILHASRVWLSLDGKPVTAKLIAFEDLVVEAPKDAPAPPAPEPPKSPTVIKDDKVRLLVGTKTFEVPIERFVPADRELIEGIRDAIDRKTSAP